MKDILKHAYKPTPERFRYSVASAVSQAEQNAPQKAGLNRPARALIAAALILALIPSAVFGASKLIGLFAKPVGNYGVELDMQPTDSDYPEYVKMSVSVPDGFEEVEGTEGMKFHRVGDTDYRSGFSLFPMRYTSGGSGEVIGNVAGYEEVTVCGRPAYRVDMLGEGVYSRLYINYDEFNVTLLVFYGEVSESELNAFVGGIHFTAGTEADHTELGEPFDERVKDDVKYTYNYKNFEFARDTVMTFSGYSESNGDESLRYSAQITGVSVTDSITGLNSDGVSPLYSDMDLTGADGKLLPNTVTVTESGNGFDTADSVISTEDKEQKLILIDLNYTNLSDEDCQVYIPYDLVIYNKYGEGFTPAEDIDPANGIFSTALCDSEVFYNSDPIDRGHNYLCTMLSAGETKTVTIGYRCCADMLDKAYLTIYDAASASIIDPAPAENGSLEIPNYIIKVL